MNRDIRKILYKNSNLLRLNKVKINDVLTISQTGGANILTVQFNHNDYKFEESEIDDNHFILYSTNENECATVIISKKDKIAEIHSIGNYKTCLYESNINVGSLSKKFLDFLDNLAVEKVGTFFPGSILLKITMKMLQKYKTKFDITMIILTDNSLKKCGTQNIKLSLMLTLLTGDTWYGKYGFRPIDYQNDEYILDKLNNKLYEKNKIISQTIKINDIKLMSFIKLTNNESLIKATERIINGNPNMLLCDYLKNMIIDYDNTCKYFITFYELLFNKIMRFDPYHRLYGFIL